MGFLASEAALGFYAVAVNASEALLYLPAAMATALLPAAARAEAGLRTEQTLRAFRSAAVVTAAAALVAALLGPLLLPVVFGASFELRSRRSCGSCPALWGSPPPPSSRTPWSRPPNLGCPPWAPSSRS